MTTLGRFIKSKKDTMPSCRGSQRQTPKRRALPRKGRLFPESSLSEEIIQSLFLCFEV
jgi:hypothetical protein